MKIRSASDYLILIESSPGSNYSCWSPDLPGCVATGADIAECRQQMLEAIDLHLTGLEEAGEEIPRPSGSGVYLELSIA